MLLIFIAAIVTSCLFAPMGCILLWQRYNYFSDGLAHSCLFAGVIAYILGISLLPAMLIVGVLFAIIVFALQYYSDRNVVINIVANSLLATALIIGSKTNIRLVDMMLFGDILAITLIDIILLLALLTIVIWLLVYKQKQLVVMAFNSDLAKAKRIPVAKLQLIILVLLGMIIAVTLKNLGALLISGLLVIPAATAKIMSHSPKDMLVKSTIIAGIASIIGTVMAFYYDTPLAPAIILIMVILYIIILTRKMIGGRL